MGKNTNKSDVQKLAKEKREQARLESAQKKLKDKEDRAKQKSSREDKKKARQAATVKGERKRWWIIFETRVQVIWIKSFWNTYLEWLHV